MPTIYIILFQWFLSVIMVICINLFGSVRRGYITIDQLLSTTNFGYNLIYRILSPAIFISFSTLVLYGLGFPYFTKNIWLVSVYYYVINIASLLLLRRFELVNKFLYIFIFLSSIGISYWLYKYALQYGPQAILPDSANFRTEWWFIVIAYFYSLLNEYTPNYSVEHKRKHILLYKRYKSLSCKYDVLLMKDINQNELLRLIFYAIMITEDINRPPFVRWIERLLFITGKIKTTGIMQVTSNKILSDKESVLLAQKIILSSYKKNYIPNIGEYDLVFKISNDYNSGGYSGGMPTNYNLLKSIINK